MAGCGKTDNNGKNVTPNLETLLASARKHSPTAAEREEQRRSFAYGNIKLHNPNITRADIDRAAEELENDKAKRTIG